MATKRWADLATGDLIVCPGDQRIERVLVSKPYTKGKHAIRTDRHDHFKPSNEKVEVR